MDPTEFQAPAFGNATRRPGDPHGFWFFHPAPIPRELPLDAATILALSEADAALGHLEGLGHLITDPQLLVGPYVSREALASSRIEGTRASLAEVLQAGAGDGEESRTEDVAEVERYIAATYRGLDLIRTLPITQRLVLDVHHVLLSGLRGQDRLPGQLRRGPVWVGSPTDSPDTAVYVPPIPELLGDLLQDWERFVNEPGRMPVLVRCALMHYQFETIHPFLDGNGRIGRLLIGLLLHQEGRLTHPLLYLSGYLESRRREYYERLQAVRERGEIQQWVQFFLTAVRRQATDGVDRATALVRLRERYLAEAARARSRIGELIKLLFANPFVTVKRVEADLTLTNQGARNLIRDAEARGWLQVFDVVGRGGRTYWVARDVFDVIEAPPACRAAGRDG
ncbi:Fic family protein [Pseudonocardia nigra]|uniref:Fic family protein n=1 Tax=Pseudonocardia nigra TaxID=1921578 RepID=UPI001C5F1BF4|nr:Fic/DOC family N-terminal domain-containing protein [Pseudonocardia nigra]